mmetsp:Transcript_12353/g.20020  ORF Transcript_12353/g.20020 Transcript_12353/m.20020 type:complete len:491 (-) Transcript_12353:180-1652(-)
MEAATIPTTKARRKAFVFVDPLTQDTDVLDRALREGTVGVCAILHALERVRSPAEESGILAWYRANEPQFEFVIGAKGVVEMLDKLQDLALQHDLEYIGCASVDHDAGLDSSDILAACLGLPHNDLKMCRARRVKSQMKIAVSEAGLRCPKFATCRTAASLPQILSDAGLSYPIVVKTPAGAGTNQVWVCHDEARARSATSAVLQGPDWFGRRPLYALLEEYIPGSEYAVNMICTPTETYVTDIWRYIKTEDSEGVMVYERSELVFDIENYSEMIDYSKKTAAAVGISVGPAHLEVKCPYVDTKEPTMMEIAARFAGGWKSRLTATVVPGWDPYQAALDALCGRTPRMPESFKPTELVFYVFCRTDRAGSIREIKGVEEIQKLPTYHSHYLFARVGMSVRHTRDIFSHPMTVFLVSKDVNRNQIESDEAAIHNLFRIVYEDEAVPIVDADETGGEVETEDTEDDSMLSDRGASLSVDMGTTTEDKDEPLV